MPATPFERAAERFEELWQLAPAERERALAGCGEPPEVLEPLRRMLAGARHPSAGLECAPPAGLPPVLPEAIGGFRVLRLLGEGGMGRVFEAEQHSPRRRVALKVLKGSFASPELRRRFENEAEVLGRLAHPGLATVYEAGSAEVRGERISYLAMELVQGETLDAYLARARPDLGERVELVARIADAVDHAHQKGVVHRDLKPSNVLVEAAGRPRVLDFGIARLTGADLELTTRHTHPGAVLGTLPYMSPEQLAGDSAAVDARADVYALGVLLYEVLSARRPFDFRGKTLAEVARIVAEEEPTLLGALDPRLRGDLETIAAKALAKEKERRYASAAELAEDLRRVLRDEPIVARPVTTLYQLLKFARRNRRFVGALGFALLSLVGGLCAALVLALREREQRALAEERALALEFQLYRQGFAEARRELAGGQRERARELVAALPRRHGGWELAHLEGQLSSADRALPSPRGAIYRLRTDRSGARLASASADGSLRVLDVASGAVRHELGSSGQPRRFDLSGDGRHAFVLSWDAAARTMTASLWEEDRLVRSQAYPSQRMGWAECAFDPAGEVVYWGWTDGLLRAWEVSSGLERYAVRVHASEVRALSIAPRGEWLVTGEHEGDGSLAIVACASGQVLRRMPTPSSAVAELAFLGAGPRFVSRGGDGVACLWDGPEDDGPACLDPSEAVLSLASSADGAHLYAGTGSGRILVVDGATARILAVHDAGLPVLSLALLDEGRVLAAGSMRGRVALLDSQTGQGRGAFAPPGAGAGNVTCLAPVKEGALLAAGHVSGALRLLPATSSFEVLHGHGSYVYGAAFARGGTVIASGSWDQTLRLWDAGSLRPLATWPLPGRMTALQMLGPERALVVLMDGESLAVDLADGRVAWRTRGPPRDGSGVALAVSPDGTRVVLVDPGNDLASLRTAHDGTVLGSRSMPAGTRALAWDPGDEWLVAGAPRRLAFLDARTLAPVQEVALEGTPQRLAFSPDGRWLAAGTREGTLAIVDVARRVLHAHQIVGQGAVYALAFHPDGTRLASGTEEGRVTLWETRTWTRLAELEPHVPSPPEPGYHYVWELAFGPDGKELVSASGDHTLRVWRAPAAGAE